MQSCTAQPHLVAHAVLYSTASLSSTCSLVQHSLTELVDAIDGAKLSHIITLITCQPFNFNETVMFALCALPHLGLR